MTGTVRYNFFVNAPDSALEEYKKIDISKDVSMIAGADLEWLVQGYLILSKRNKISVSCSNTLDKEAINVIHSDNLIDLKNDGGSFIVCLRADYPRRSWAHYHLVQNKNQLEKNSSFIPLWLQPGIIPRDSTRNEIKTVAYAGQTYNGNLAGSSDTWKGLLEKHGFDFIVLPTGACNDMSSIDALVGIRSFDTKPYNSKPPSKLINAWHSKVPFIGGYDSAFMQVGTPGEDYLRAKSATEVVTSLLRLRDEPDLYARLVSNGLKKAPFFTNDTIAEVWEEVLTGPVLKRYQKWKQRPALEKRRFNTLFQIGLLEHKSKQFIKKILNLK